MPKLIGVCCAGALFVAAAAAQTKLEPQVVKFPVGKTSRSGYIYKPEGKGPFPTIIWIHAYAQPLLKGPTSEYEGIAKAYLSANYVLFLPDKHSTNVELNEYSEELQQMIKKNPKDPATEIKKYLEMLDINARDTVAAVDWLCRQPYVNANRLALSGWSSGGAICLLAAERDTRISACVPFTPGARTWDENPASQAVLRRAVKNARMPMFLIQTQNDKSLGPSEVLGKELKKKGEPNRVKIYPAFGKSLSQSGCLATAGWEIWGWDVMTFLDDVWK